MSRKNLKPLSASKIKTLKGCSWKYWCSYGLSLPRTGNDGSRRGSATHDFLECLARPDRRHMVELIIDKKDPFAFESTEKYIKLLAKRECVDDEENIETIKEFILTALRSDFFGEKLMLSEKPEDHAELFFDESVEKPSEGIKYRVRGFIDRIFLYRDKGEVLIRDYKTSKRKFEGEDASNNLQDLIYSLAASRMFPKFGKRIVEFLFLKFDPDVDKDHKNQATIEMEPICDGELYGLEHELTHYQNQVDNFDENSAVSNFAKDQGFPTDKSFSGCLQCGFAKHKGQLKKDGNIMWHCEFKFPFDFYRIFNKSGEEVACLNAEEFNIEKVPEGGDYKKYNYSGCPKFN